jgi:hypothetical protein
MLCMVRPLKLIHLTAWGCPFCDHVWPYRPSAASKCPGCSAVVRGDFKVEKMSELVPPEEQDTPVERPHKVPPTTE